MRIVITEDLWWPLPEWMSAQYEIIYDPQLHTDTDRIIQVTERAHAIVVRNNTQMNRQLLERLPHLKVIGRLGVGLDNIDLQACRERGITVVAAKGCNANAVAEYVIASLFHHTRFLSQCHLHTRNGNWDRQRCMGREVHGKTLGLIGVGDIGQRVAIRARALGMNVIAYDPFLLPTHLLIQDFAVGLHSLSHVCQTADYISIHVPLTPDTHHLISVTELTMMKEDSVLINTARGGIVDEAALLDHLKNWPHRFAVLDVREQEPSALDDPFQNLPNVLLTPHIAGITHESSERVAQLVLQDVDRVLQGERASATVV